MKKMILILLLSHLILLFGCKAKDDTITNEQEENNNTDIFDYSAYENKRVSDYFSDFKYLKKDDIKSIEYLFNYNLPYKINVFNASTDEDDINNLFNLIDKKISPSDDSWELGEGGYSPTIVINKKDGITIKIQLNSFRNDKETRYGFTVNVVGGKEIIYLLGDKFEILNCFKNVSSHYYTFNTNIAKVYSLGAKSIDQIDSFEELNLVSEKTIKYFNSIVLEPALDQEYDLSGTKYVLDECLYYLVYLIDENTIYISSKSIIKNEIIDNYYEDSDGICNKYYRVISTTDFSQTLIEE